MNIRSINALKGNVVSALRALPTLICLLAPLAGFAQGATLVTTFTTPAPTSDEKFGSSVALVGNDRVLIGGYNGAAYLFSTDGTLLTVFTNGVPGESESALGVPVAAVGSDRVLICGYVAA